MNAKFAHYSAPRRSVADRVLTFFKANPEEFLSTTDIADKFDVPHLRVHSHLAGAVEAGALKRWESLVTGQLTYALPSYSVSAPAVMADVPLAPKGDAYATPAEPAEPARKRQPVSVDTSLLVIDKGVPLPRINARQQTDWQGLLARMDVSDSVALPAQARSSISKCANEFGKKTGARFAVRVVGEGQIRVWRTA